MAVCFALWFVSVGAAQDSSSARSSPITRIAFPGLNWKIDDRDVFVYLPQESKRSDPQPWIFYAPTLSMYPDNAERWMHEQFLNAGIAVAGIDVGEAYGSPTSHPYFERLYVELTEKHHFAKKACYFGRSRGGLWVGSWAIAHPDRVSGIIGIYPVYDFKTYPKLEAAAPAYGLTPSELASQAKSLNPIERIDVLAKAKIPFAIIHGDVDTVVPIAPNSAALRDVYKANGAEDLVELIVVPGQGHNFWEGFFHEQKLVDSAIRWAREGAK